MALVTFIRFNPDKFSFGREKQEYPGCERFQLLFSTILKEIEREIDTMEVRLIQLFYDTPKGVRKYKQKENITRMFDIEGDGDGDIEDEE